MQFNPPWFPIELGFAAMARALVFGAGVTGVWLVPFFALVFFGPVSVVDPAVLFMMMFVTAINQALISLVAVPFVISGLIQKRRGPVRFALIGGLLGFLPGGVMALFGWWKEAGSFELVLQLTAFLVFPVTSWLAAFVLIRRAERKDGIIRERWDEQIDARPDPVPLLPSEAEPYVAPPANDNRKRRLLP